jgi:hypothetical protein
MTICIGSSFTFNNQKGIVLDIKDTLFGKVLCVKYEGKNKINHLIYSPKKVICG